MMWLIDATTSERGGLDIDRIGPLGLAVFYQVKTSSTPTRYQPYSHPTHATHASGRKRVSKPPCSISYVGCTLPRLEISHGGGGVKIYMNCCNATYNSDVAFRLQHVPCVCGDTTTAAECAGKTVV